MKNTAFIGAGRITGILLQGMKSAEQDFSKITVYDPDTDHIEKIRKIYPEIIAASSAVEAVQNTDIIILAVHPPLFRETADKIKNRLNPETIILSLIPKFNLSVLHETFIENKNIIRMNPNAPTIINEGFNPVSFSENFDPVKKDNFINFFSVLGKMPEVKDELLEAFAVITAMGHTYFDFQFLALLNLAEEFGIDEKTAKQAIIQLAYGTAKTAMSDIINKDDVLNLVPVRPLSDYENTIRNTYEEKLRERYNLLKV